MNLHLLSKIPQFFFAPPEAGTKGGIVDVGDISDRSSLEQPGRTDEDILGDVYDKDNKPKGEKKKEKKETDDTDDSQDDDSDDKENEEGQDEDEEGSDDDEGDEDEEGEGDEEGDEEDEDSEVEDDNVYQALKKVDKDIFKKIPDLRAVIFRERQFTEHFATPEEAEHASRAVEALSNYERDLGEGKSDKLIEFLHKGGSLQKFGANLLKTIESKDKNVYYGIIAPEFKQFFRMAMNDPNDAIKNSAKNLHYFFFGDHNYDKNEGLSPVEKSEKETEIEKRERELTEKQTKAFLGDVAHVSERRAKKLISKGFEGVDISDRMKEYLTNDIYKRLGEALDKDTRYVGNIRGLFRKAAQEGFTSEGKDRLISTFLSRAKLLIPQIRQKVLKEARINAKAAEGSKKKAKRVPGSSSESGSGGKKVFNPRDPKNAGKTELDILNGNF